MEAFVATCAGCGKQVTRKIPLCVPAGWMGVVNPSFFGPGVLEICSWKCKYSLELPRGIEDAVQLTGY